MTRLPRGDGATFFLTGDTWGRGRGELRAHLEVRWELGPAPMERHSGGGGGACRRPSWLWAWNLDFGVIILLSSFI